MSNAHPPSAVTRLSAMIRRRDPRVLIVDDDPQLREVTCEVLTELGFQVSEAESGEEALKGFEAADPDLVLLDVHMGPGRLSGFETCERLRATAGGETLPVVMLTGDGDSETIQRAFDCGATDFEQKGVSPTVLGKRLRFMYRSKQILDDLRDSELRLESAQHLARVGSWEWDARNSSHLWSLEMHRIHGLDPVKARPDQALFLSTVNEEDRSRVAEAMKRALTSGEPYELEYRLDRPGESVIVQHRGEPVIHEGEILGLCGTVQDITALRQAEERIRHLVYFDPLTGLPNRTLFLERASAALAAARRQETHAAVIFLDLDGFKAVNDTFGHDAGDRLLEEAAKRLRSAVREVDAVARFEPEAEAEGEGEDDPTVCRLGGDEFVVLLTDVRRDEDVGTVAWRLVESLRAPFDVCGSETFVTGSAGVAVYPKDGEEPGALLKHADSAMYAAKERGRDHVAFFDPALNEKVARRLGIVSGLRGALQRDELELHYQPIVDAGSGLIVAAECLVRWRHPERGLVYPGEFIPIAEDAGLIVPLSEWVIQAACCQQCSWRQRGVRVPLSFNISSRHFENAEVADRLEEIARSSGADPSGLTVEVTESLLLRDTATTQRDLRRLKSLGVSVALDDFGTGYSSLSYLRQFPVDRVKVDRCFVMDLESNPDSVALVEAIALLSRRLGIEPLAEGVETDGQHEILRSSGYVTLQGFLFSRPIPAVDFLRLLQLGERARG